jgi:hypothetical protein
VRSVWVSLVPQQLQCQVDAFDLTEPPFCLGWGPPDAEVGSDLLQTWELQEVWVVADNVLVEDGPLAAGRRHSEVLE